VFDAGGNRIRASVTRLAVASAPSVNLLESHRGLATRTASGLSILSRELLNKPLEVTILAEGGDSAKASILFSRCPHRQSIRVGSSENYGDTTGETIRGRVKGCRPDESWWLRATPMFGAQHPRFPLEGTILSDGTFYLEGPMEGERHILVFGKGRDPLKSIGINVTVAGNNDVGAIDLSKECSPR
jgi:hypothetical protein